MQADRFAQFGESDADSMPCNLLKDGERATEGLYGNALTVRRTVSDIALKRF